jgi:Leucine-rich repeat (LRR) protein
MNLESEIKRLSSRLGNDYTKIHQLYLHSKEEITDLGGLQNVPNLWELVLTSMPRLTNIEALVNVPELHRLKLTDAPQLVNIETLKHLGGLKVLDLSGNMGLTDIGVLSHLPLLEQLNLSGTQAPDISPIINSPELAYVFLHNMPITDYTPLLSLKKLRLLGVGGINKHQNSSLLKELENRGVSIY